uniref:DUF3883 domain-containing protein n=1 Tax=Echinostoma caproni TaxID=27848 RepID=A0A183ARX5_9TREM
LATSSSSGTKENEFDASFLERRQGVIAEVKGSGNVTNRALSSASSRFHAGGSKHRNLHISTVCYGVSQHPQWLYLVPVLNKPLDRKAAYAPPSTEPDFAAAP